MATNTLTKKEYDKQYRQLNKERLRAQEAKWRKDNPDMAKAQQARYRETHKEILRERGITYRMNNKERISEKNKEKVTCECGTVLTKKCLSRHRKTQNHSDLLKSKLEEKE